MRQIDLEGEVLQLTASSFQADVLDNPTPILIDFWAPWCGPCRAMKPILHQVAELLKGRVRVAQVNVDDERELAAAFGIRSIPTCVLIKEDTVLGGFVGVIPAEKLVADILGRLSAS